MSDLIKRIDAWIDSYSRCGGEADQIGIRIMQECKAALEAKGEPVAWYAQDNLEVKYDIEVIWGRSKPVYAEVWIPLYTTPPNIEALIAEIDEWGNRVGGKPDIKEIVDKWRTK